MTFRCGTIAIVGQPNVGKSSLLNKLVGAKLAITSRRPQTTRHILRGIVTTNSAQYVFVDTPGYQTAHGGAMNRALNRTVGSALGDVDVVMPVVVAGRFTPADATALALIAPKQLTVIAINKVDLLERRDQVLPFLAEMQARYPAAILVPLSARSGFGTKELLRTLAERLPEQSALFSSDELTDRDERFLASELIREKLFRSLGDEVPYGAVVTIDQFKEDGALRRIQATIVVDRDGHRGIIIGKGGERLKSIASSARIDMEKLFGGKVFLEVWVKVKSGWTEDIASLRRFGFDAS